MGLEISKYFGCSICGTDVLKYVNNMNYVQMKHPDKLPFKNKEFDVAMLNGVLHHIDFNEQEAIIKEALRVAKILYVQEDKPHLRSKIICFILNKIHNPNMRLPETFRTEKEWSKILKVNSLKIKLPFWYPIPHIIFKISSIKYKQ